MQPLRREACPHPGSAAGILWLVVGSCCVLAPVVSGYGAERIPEVTIPVTAAARGEALAEVVPADVARSADVAAEPLAEIIPGERVLEIAVPRASGAGGGLAETVEVAEAPQEGGLAEAVEVAEAPREGGVTADAPRKLAAGEYEGDHVLTIQIPSAAPEGYRPGQFEDQTDARNRLHAQDLKKEYGPEALGVFSDVFNSGEVIHRERLAGRWYTSNRWNLAFILERSDFRITQGGPVTDPSANLTRLDSRVTGILSEWLSAWGTLTLYANSADQGAGAQGQIIFRPSPNVELRLRPTLFMPWDGSTRSVQQGGMESGGDGSLSFTWLNRIELLLEGGYLNYSVKGDLNWGQQAQAAARLYTVVYRGPNAPTGTGFLDPNAMVSNPLDNRLLAYLSVERRSFQSASTIVGIVSRSEDMRMGLDYAQPFNRHWGISAGAYLGRDQLRHVDFGKLYGVDTRVLFTVSDRLRFWTSYNFDSEPTAGTPGGRTTSVRGGLNLNF